MEFLKLTDNRLVDLLKHGGVGVLPTDTVYGLVCDASNAEAVARLYQLKSREQKPGTLIAATPEQVIALGIAQDEVRHAAQFWPGVSVVMSSSESLTYLHQGLGTLAVRIVAHQELETLLQKTGPLLTSSANFPGKPPANTLNEAQAYFGNTVDFYVDGGDLSGRQSSTLIRVVDGVPEVLRQGSISSFRA
ncbi:MAG: L-threonylcarbamoyladenylate synthase [Patescibacteria group bacterium]